MSSLDALVVEDLSRHKLQARRIAAALQRTYPRVQLVDLDQGAGAIAALAQRTQPRLVVSSLLFADRLDEHLGLMTELRKVVPHAYLALAGHLTAFAQNELKWACPALDSVGAVDVPDPLDSPPIRDDVPLTFRGYGFATIEASRSCYHACAFCLPAAFYRARGMPYALREISSVVDEIASLYADGVRLYLFDDEQFLPPGQARAKRVTALGEGLAKRNLQIAFTIKCRADDVDRALFKQLQDIGLLRVYIGLESGSQTSLDLFRKGTSVQQNVKALVILDELGIVADFRTLLFHPWSTLETIAEELAFAKSVLPYLPTLFDFREVEIYPGTPLADKLASQRRLNGRRLPLPYALTDERAELLRRLFRFIFNTSGEYGHAQKQITEAWYDLLLRQRFQASGFDKDTLLERKAAVAILNQDTLELWEEMLNFVQSESIFDAEVVNTRASKWAQRINEASGEGGYNAGHR